MLDRSETRSTAVDPAAFEAKVDPPAINTSGPELATGVEASAVRDSLVEQVALVSFGR